MNFRMDFSISAKDVIGILTEMGIDSVITLGSTDTSIVSKSMTSSSLLKTVLCMLSLLDELDTRPITFQFLTWDFDQPAVHLCINSGENCYLILSLSI